MPAFLLPTQPLERAMYSEDAINARIFYAAYAFYRVWPYE